MQKRHQKQIMQEISRIEAFLKFKRVQNAKRKKTEKTAKVLLNVQLYSETIEDFKNLKENIDNIGVLFNKPQVAYQYAEIKVEKNR